jgi:hypothetical protein
MLQAATSPYVMIRLGRREDRAAAYDRFIAECHLAFSGKDPGQLHSLWNAWQSINMRCRRDVREAAELLVKQVMNTVTAHAGGRVFYPDVRDEAMPSPREDRRQRTDEEMQTWEEERFLREVGEFVEAVRGDLQPFYWRWFLPPPVKRWWLRKL